MRVLTATGVLAPMTFAAAIVIASIARPGYDQTRQLISELGEEGAPTELFFNMFGFALLGALLLTFSVGVRSAAGSWRPAIGITLFGAGALLASVFRCEAGCPVPAQTFGGFMHFPVLTLVAYAGMAIGPLLAASWLASRDDTARYSRPSLFVAGLIVGLIAATLAASGVAGGRVVGFGLLQRLFVGIDLLWTAAFALLLLRAERSR